MVKSILIGGKAGQGPNLLTSLIAESLIEKGYYVFYSRDYQSLIRGGHNFNILTFSSKPINSNESKVDLIIALDEETIKIHKKDLKKPGIVLNGNQDNMYFAGAMFKAFELDFKILEEKLKKLRNFKENLENAKLGFEQEKKEIKINAPKIKNPNFSFMNGSRAIAEASIKSGLDIYYAYPMTPATPLMFELAPKQKENNFLLLELENEIAVINAAIGSSITGAKTMLGTSGGGFDLMTEALSMACQAEIPLVCYLASRPGPGTGVATYTAQGDLHFARYSGHGEAFRLVLAPGSADEAQSITSEAFYFSQKYKIPVIILSDKHLAESFFTYDKEPKLTKSQFNTKLIRYNSYEHTKTGEATEDSELINQGFERREKKKKEIEKEAEKFQGFKIYGNKQSKNLIVSYGSTKGAILDAIKDLDCKFLQVLYIEPFSKKIKAELEKAKNIILVENSAHSQLRDLIAEKTQIKINDKNKILKYDGRPFFFDELNSEIKKRLR